MQTLLMTLALFTAPAQAQDVCLGTACFEEALRAGLAAEGLEDVDGLNLTVDATGATWMTVTSNDAVGLERAAAATRSPVSPIRGTDAFVATVPVDLSGLGALVIDSGTGTQQIGLLLPAVQGPSGGGGGGGGGNDCVQVCVCTEDGYECWLVCGS